ncbi:MAG: AEC family transporter, partial [Clostridia bacterium]|nr:AEC family transporter [Clostridia bacterium]
MSVFISTLNQTAVLISFILIGFVLKKAKKLPDNTSVVLARLENMLFVPALVMGTFIEKFTLSEIGRFGKLFGISFIMIGIMMPVAVLLSKLLTKDKYEQNIFTYGLAFSNFGFVGNAVVQAVFPEIFLEYM